MSETVNPRHLLMTTYNMLLYTHRVDPTLPYMVKLKALYESIPRVPTAKIKLGPEHYSVTGWDVITDA